MPADSRAGGGSRAAVAVGCALVTLVGAVGIILAAHGGSHEQSSHAAVNKAHQEEVLHAPGAEHATLTAKSQHVREEKRLPKAPEDEDTVAEPDDRDATNHSEEHVANDTNLTDLANLTNVTNHTNHTNRSECSGGPDAACECILKCEVFGNASSSCGGRDQEEKIMVDRVISKTMLSHRNMCDGMRCIKECARELGCLDEKVRADCAIVKKNYDSNRLPSDPKCDLRCDE